jgi:subtilisin family serine protease
MTSKTTTQASVPASGYGKLPTGKTGRHLVFLNPDSPASIVQSFEDMGIKLVSSETFKDGIAPHAVSAEGRDGVFYGVLNAAVIEGDKTQIAALYAAIKDESNPVIHVEDELYVVPFNNVGLLEDDEPNVGLLENTGILGGASDCASPLLTGPGAAYVRGYRDAIGQFAQQLLGSPSAAAESVAAARPAAVVFADTPTLTWGLQATRVATSPYDGRGIRVAVLDTGLDLTHPDFAGRALISESFVAGQAVQDGHGHGTHCVGTACGPAHPAHGGRRYGIASKATILVGKVLSNSGSGTQGSILNGMNWAIRNKAVIISMSLGSPVAVGDKPSEFYERVAQAALEHSCLVIAAAGNSGTDPADYPVGSPANCQSIVGVGAVDPQLKRAAFSCIGVNPDGGELNIAAPGVNIFSTKPLPEAYGTLSGTSMATPHVAGIAALWAQATGLKGMALWLKLQQSALAIGQTPREVGAGLVQAPQ